MSDRKPGRTLLDLGERAIVDRILRKYCDPAMGSDCAILDVVNGRIVVTTDPVPEPAALVIGGDSDLYWRGWLLTIINASDLAAAGAHPLAFLSAIEAPSSLSTVEFERFVEGISDACKAEGLRYVGGNLKEGNRILGVGTALGWVGPTGGLTRSGVKTGDLIAVVGSGGLFWRDALLVRAGKPLSDVHASPLFRPRSQLRAMRLLSDRLQISAAIDNSDGLLPSLNQLCATNRLGATVDLNRLTAPPAYTQAREILGISHPRLWLGWGDWNVVIAIDRTYEHQLNAIAANEGLDVTVCGEFDSSNPALYLEYNHCRTPAPRIESERFSADSWFSAGIQQYIETLRSAPLPGGL